jgi:hypothetical protein
MASAHPEINESCWSMLKSDKQTNKEISKFKYDRDINVIQYFEKLFNILHKDILKEAKDRYAKYIVKHTELRNKLNKLFKNKNNYEYRYYIIMYNDIEKEIKKNERKYYDVFEDGLKRLGKAKFLMDEKCCDEEQLMKKLNKLKDKLSYVFL